MYQEVFVVEGLHDKQKLETIYPGVQCIVTNGTEIADATIDLIKSAATSRGVILFLDPDHPGRMITDRIVNAVPGVKIAFLPRRAAISANGRKIGVEHASAEAIATALKDVRTIGDAPLGDVTINDLIKRGLAGTKDAAGRRERVAGRLGLPTANAKTLLKWLNMLGIPAERLDG